MKAVEFFSSEERERIEAAVREVESRTSGEIVPLVVDAAYDYPRTEILAAGCFALGTGLFFSWAFGDSSIWVFLPVFLLVFLPFRLLLRRWPGLKRRLIHPDEIDAEVEEKAMVSFLDLGLHRTREGTGVLIMLSLFEHRVFVLAGRGIDQVVPDGTWQHVVELVTRGIKEQNACHALCEAIRYCGDLIEDDFPRRDDDEDELPNLIVE